MSLLGIDVGTTGCKAVAFALDGQPVASAYREYDLQRPQPGWAELDAGEVWAKVQQTIAEVAQGTAADPIAALAVSSMGEATVPVTLDRQILGPSINPNFDLRGEAYLDELARTMDPERLYRISGNPLGNNYALTRLKWLKDRRPDLYRRADRFLLWGSLVPFMLGAAPSADYSLANRTLLFDVNAAQWSDELIDWAGLDRAKLPEAVPSGAVIGHISKAAAGALGLPENVVLVSGAHDQCANAVGCGAIEAGQAVWGMGTFFCMTPVFCQRRDLAAMADLGLTTEHHAVPGRYVCFIYNQGGALLKWYRDTFAAREHRQAEQAGRDIYQALIAEVPDGPSSVVVLPHFAPTGPPEFLTETRGVMAGLQLETTRGDILKGVLEGVVFYLKGCIDALPATGIAVDQYRAVGGGSRSDAWVQLCADIVGQPFTRPAITEAGALGAAIMAGVGSGTFASFAEGVEAMVRPDRVFTPDDACHRAYGARYETYRQLGPLMRDYLAELARG